MDTLKFSFGNSKINKLAVYLGLAKKSVVSFDLPAGHTCPMANICKATADPITGKITDSQGMIFRCYASSSEAAFTTTRKLRWHNYNLLKGKTLTQIIMLIEASIPNFVKVVRIHSSGDFFSLNYFKAWVIVAKNHPEINFFGYTKVLPYVNYPKSDNFHLVYSHGGKMDNKITTEPVAYVVNTVNDAIKKGLQVSCQDNPVDDYELVMQDRTFALVLHGTQPAKR